MLEALEVVVPNHPKARERNKFDAPVDVKEHDWVHTNVKFVGTPVQYGTVYKAFKGTTPFTDLGYKAQADCPTHTISRWSVRECPVAKYDGDSLWLAFESRGGTPHQFLQYVADAYRHLDDVEELENEETEEEYFGVEIISLDELSDTELEEMEIM